MIAVLRIMEAFGVGGGLRVFILSENLTSYREICDKNGKNFSFRIQRFMEKSKAIIFLDGIVDRNAAESIKNEYFYVKRCDLPAIPQNEFYLCDLIGKDVDVENSDIKCKIVGAQNFGAGDLLEISHGDGSFLVPFTSKNFPDTNGKALMTLQAFEGFKN
ncbi:MAG: ribosome maturation factor RimM [Holosporaceae bacterium]|nr:ribosome maturation factor RimM [Holosporaceae bacterium]